MIQALLAFLGGSSVVRIFSIITFALFLKRLFLFLLYVALPFVLFTFGFGLFQFFTQWMLDFITAQFPSALTVTLTGVGGYLYNQMYVGTAFAIILSAISTRFIADYVRKAILRG